MSGFKAYVDVVAKFTGDGRLIPLSLIWTDGHVYEIQKVTDIQHTASIRTGGVGIRYTCMIDGCLSHIFCEDSSRWFVEKR